MIGTLCNQLKVIEVSLLSFHRYRSHCGSLASHNNQLTVTSWLSFIVIINTASILHAVLMMVACLYLYGLLDRF